MHDLLYSEPAAGQGAAYLEALRGTADNGVGDRILKVQMTGSSRTPA